MLRTAVLGVANRRLVRSVVTGGPGRQVALRFVAGETIEDVLRVLEGLGSAGFDASVDYLGENITDLTQARAATEVYLKLLDRIAAGGLRANVSVKLTQLGLDVDAADSLSNAKAILARAAQTDTSVTLDMEDHHYTDRTIETCLRLNQLYPGRVGIAVQAYLHRTPDDLSRLTDDVVQVRLCKGAYKEPRSIAYRSREEVDAAFRSLSTQLLSSDSYAMIASHDEAVIEHALAEAKKLGRARETYEVQMLYGVRRELQRGLLARGEKVRIYVPFGSQWYPYLMRRIAERPGNIRFFAEALLRK